jgi:hypothetical protein
MSNHLRIVEPGTPPCPAMPERFLRVRVLAEMLADDPGYEPPEAGQALIGQVEGAIAAATALLAPGDPTEVVAGLQVLAERRGLAMPSGFALELDAEIMGGWPRDLWRKAFRLVWERFEYRRMLEVPDFRRHIAQDLADREAELRRLDMLAKRLSRRRDHRAAETPRYATRPVNLGDTATRIAGGR